jgi:hypothetical protein
MSRTTWAVAVYDVRREYGGPEEGGWWYDSEELLGVEFWFHDEEAAYEMSRTLNWDYHEAREEKRAHVVEVPRREPPEWWRNESCHSDPDAAPSEDEYVTRWDIPTYLPEERQHYC